MSRLAFFGTPEFSLPSLEGLYRYCQDFSHELSLVVCQPDKPQGRGQHMQAPPVKKLAQKLNIDVVQPESLRKNTPGGDLLFETLKNKKIDLAVVTAYGRIIPERVLGLPALGFVNVHASLLPRFRGAAPIQRALEAGDKITGVCLMDMVKKLDEGDIYVCESTPILAFDTSLTLFHRLSHLGGSLLYRHLDDLLNRRLKKIPQSTIDISYAHMLEKHEGLLDFSLPADVLSHKVQAYDPWPGAYGYIHEKRVQFFDSFFITDASLKMNAIPGTIITISPFLGVKTSNGAIFFQTIQVEGKKVLSIQDALKGFPIKIGERIKNAR